MKRAIVTFASHKLNYVKAVRRLVKSMKGNFDGDVLYWIGEENLPGCPKHSENPYAFKIFAIREALKKGCEQILWLDSSVWAIKNMETVFQEITEHGFFFEDSGHMVGTWANDFSLAFHNITRDQANEMKMISSGFVGFDFTTDLGNYLFLRWEYDMMKGVFIGSWEDHRHDQTSLSIIINKLNLYSKVSTPNRLFSYVGEGYPPPKETAICYLAGM